MGSNSQLSDLEAKWTTAPAATPTPTAPVAPPAQALPELSALESAWTKPEASASSTSAAAPKSGILKQLGDGIAQFATDTFNVPSRSVAEAQDFMDYAAKNGTNMAAMRYGAEFMANINLPVFKELQQDIKRDLDTLDALAPHPNRLTDEDRKALGRGLVNIGTMFLPMGKAAKAGAAIIPNPVVRRIAEIEAHSIASMVAWSVGTAVVEDTPILDAAKQGIIAGAITPPLAKGAGFALGKAIQGAAFAGSKTIGPAAAAVDEALSRVKAYNSARYLFDRFWDNNGYVGETFLRRMGLDQVADDLVNTRSRIFMRAGIWHARVGRAFNQLTAGDRELAARTLNETITDTQLQSYTKTDIGEIRAAAKELKDTLFRAGSLLQQIGVPVIDPADDSVHRFVMRKDFGTPHVYVNTEQYIKPGKMRDDAIAALMQRNGMTQAKAELFLEKFHARNMGEIDAITTGRGKIRGSVAMLGRRYNLPGYATDPAEYIPSYLFSVARRIENTLRFGDPLKPHVPTVHTPEAIKRVVEGTRQMGGGTFNLDPHMKVYQKRGLTVSLSGKVVPSANFDESVVNEVLQSLPDLQKKFPGIKFTLNTWVENGMTHTELGTVFDKKAEAMSLARQAQRETVGVLGHKGRTLKARTTGITASSSLTMDQASDALTKWLATDTGRPFRDAPGLPKVLTARTLYPKAFEPLEAIEDAGKRSTAEAIIARQLGFSHNDTFSLKEKRALSVAMAAQAVMKLGLSQISQLSQFVTPAGMAGFRGAMKDMLLLGSKNPELQDRMVRTGAFLQTLIRQSEQQLTGAANGLAVKALDRSGFTFMDTQARRYGVLRGWSMASHQAERLGELWARKNVLSNGVMDKLEMKYIDNQLAVVERKFSQLGLDAAAIAKRGGQLLPEEYLKAGQTLSTAVNFWGDSLSMPAFSQSEWGRVLYQFKSFVIQQSRFMKNYAIKPAVEHGDVGPLLKLMIAGQLSGEFIQDVKSGARAKPRTVEGWSRILSNYAAFGTFGILGDMWESTVDPGRVAGQIIGPTGSDIANLAYGTGQAFRGNPKPLLKQAVSTFLPAVPFVGPVITPAVVNTLFPSKEQK